MRSFATEFSATHVACYHLCHRKLWLFHRRLQMEPRSDTVGEDKLIHETAYRRRATRWRELNLVFVKIDHFDPEKRLVREIKKVPNHLSTDNDDFLNGSLQSHLLELKEEEEPSQQIYEWPPITQEVELVPAELNP